MATVRDLINDALQTNGTLGQGETLSDDDVNTALRALQRMLGTWANQNLLLYQTAQGTMALTPGTVSYSSALLSTGRPVSVDSAFLRMSGVDYPLDLVDNQTYNEQQYKSNTGLPFMLYVDAGWPDTTFTFFPAPSAAYTAYVSGRYALIAGAITKDTVVSLPLGYEAALVDNLAVKTASLFGRQVDGVLMKSAVDAIAWLKRTNQVSLVMETNLPFNRPRYNGLMGPI